MGALFLLLLLLLVLCLLLGSRFNQPHSGHHQPLGQAMGFYADSSGSYVVQYDKLLGLAAHALAEGQDKAEPDDLWKEPSVDASAWKPCANNNTEFTSQRPASTGYIMVSANGGLNQQRVAICNAVAVSRLLNATLVIPRFLYSNVWKDESQFEDIYQLDMFMDHLKDEITIVKELPEHLRSLDLEAIGSLLTDMDVAKEAKPSFYVAHVLPILLRNRVVHFYGFGHRLSFDPVPFHIQRLRCKCNFHALRFSTKIQRTAALLITRMREGYRRWGSSEEKPKRRDGVSSSNLVSQLLCLENNRTSVNTFAEESKYLGLHLRFEIDMAAYSMCEFGGGESERMELEAYRETHFPTLTKYQIGGKLPSAASLREDGKCPMTPEEAALMLAALGFKRDTRIYLAGAEFFGGRSRTIALLSLYPNLVTKEALLSPKEIESFAKSSSQLAALDFIVSAAADAFAMTDPGSQFSALVSGYRMYYGEGTHPTIRPNKRRLANILSVSESMDWEEFQTRIRKSIKETKRIDLRPIARSVYRHPRCRECMCRQASVATDELTIIRTS